MKLNLLLSLRIAVNIVVGQILPHTPFVTNTASSLNASPTPTNVVIPKTPNCNFEGFRLTREAESCSNRNGYYAIGYAMDCNSYYACFLPSGEKKIFPFAIKAQDPSECIYTRGEYYCSADLTNVECPDCTFTEFVQKVDDLIGYNFGYKTIDVTNISTPIELPTETSDKIECVYGSSLSLRDLDCEIIRRGYLINMSLYPNCDDIYYACLLPNNRKISKYGVAAQNLTECITIYDDPIMDIFQVDPPVYCSVGYTNIPCPEGKKECSFTELLQEFSNIFGDYFIYEKSNTTSTEAVTIPEKEFCGVLVNTFYKEKENCEKRNGIVFSRIPVNDEGFCEYKYACFLPSGIEKLLPDAFKAQDPSECIVIDDHYYCSADLNNIECPECTFPQFVERVEDILDYSFERVDMTNITEPILLPKDVPSKNVECIIRKPAPEIPNNVCREVDGMFFNIEFYPDCEKTYYTCFIPQNIEPEENAIKAQDLSECIVISGTNTIYCAADYYDGVTCPEGKENCTFTEYVQEMTRIFGDYFNYEPYILEDTSEITTEITTDFITDFTTDSLEDIY